MKRYPDAFSAGFRRLAIPLFILVAVLGPPKVHSDTSGLKIGIAVDSEFSNTLKSPLGSRIGLTMSVSNKTKWTIYTKLGFSQSEFYRFLLLTGPSGGKYIYISETEKVDTMPPAISFGNRQVILAEEIAPDFVKQVVIEDLGQLFPMINTEPGWYTIEARLPFLRFAEIISIENFGVLGPVDDIDNIWRGTVVSKKIQFYRYPASGGQIRVWVVEASATQTLPLFQVPVKLFKSKDVDVSGSLEKAWTKAKVVLEGTTDNNGQTQWNSETSPCLIGDDYTVVARYSEDYRNSIITAGDSGWQLECTGSIERIISFDGAAPPPEPIDDLAAQAKSGKVQLTWTPTQAFSYNVYRSTTAGGPYAFLASTTSTKATYRDTAVTDGVSYYYVVSQVDQNGIEHGQSNEASATPQA